MKLFRTFLALGFLSVLPCTPAATNEHAGHNHASHKHDDCDCDHPESRAPIGVMGDHQHGQGEFMASYRYMFMSMDGNRMGDTELSVSQIGTGGGLGFPIVPTRMYMQMHMLGGMYALTDRVTLMGMLPIKDIRMDHVNVLGVSGPAGSNFRTTSSGPGDLTLSALTRIFENEHNSLHLNLGFSLPLGSISERDFAPSPGSPTFQEVVLPYPMQLGSGTIDLRPGLTWLGQNEDWSWGAQSVATLRLGRNRHNYSLGDQIEASTWISRRINSWVSSSVRLRGLAWGNIDGRDPRLPTVGPLGFPVETMDPNRRGGTRMDILFGANIQIGSGWLKGHRIGLEAGMPLLQYLDGPQLQTDWTMTAGWQYAF